MVLILKIQNFIVSEFAMTPLSSPNLLKWPRYCLRIYLHRLNCWRMRSGHFYHVERAQVLDWLEKHGEVFLRKNVGIGRNLQKARLYQKSHETFEGVVQVKEHRTTIE